MKKLLLATFFLMTLSGCATLEKMHQQWLVENCNINSAYSNGLTDGLKPGGMPNNYASSCPVNQDNIGVSYLRGFSKGLEGRPKEITVNQNIHRQSK